jgi:hypothetical protein
MFENQARLSQRSILECGASELEAVEFWHDEPEGLDSDRKRRD